MALILLLFLLTSGSYSLPTSSAGRFLSCASCVRFAMENTRVFLSVAQEPSVFHGRNMPTIQKRPNGDDVLAMRYAWFASLFGPHVHGLLEEGAGGRGGGGVAT